nr:diuretic hormone class 2 [Danaus plexippus plexippus]
MARLSCLFLCCLLGVLVLAVPAFSYPSIHSTTNTSRFSFKEDITSEKRALDLGLSRGYSGAIQAKHLMGLAAANYAGGPGRRRRDTH